MVIGLAPLPNALPDAAVPTLGDRIDDYPHVNGDDVADLAVGYEIAGVHDSRIALRLEADEGRQPGGLRGVRHLLRLGQMSAKWPFAADWLSRADGGQDQFLVPGHADDDRDEVDLGMRRHLVDVVEGEVGAEFLRRGLCGLRVRGAHRL